MTGNQYDPSGIGREAIKGLMDRVIAMSYDDYRKKQNDTLNSTAGLRAALTVYVDKCGYDVVLNELKSIKRTLNNKRHVGNEIMIVVNKMLQEGKTPKEIAQLIKRSTGRVYQYRGKIDRLKRYGYWDDELGNIFNATP